MKREDAVWVPIAREEAGGHGTSAHVATVGGLRPLRWRTAPEMKKRTQGAKRRPVRLQERVHLKDRVSKLHEVHVPFVGMCLAHSPRPVHIAE